MSFSGSSQSQREVAICTIALGRFENTARGSQATSHSTGDSFQSDESFPLSLFLFKRAIEGKIEEAGKVGFKYRYRKWPCHSLADLDQRHDSCLLHHIAGILAWAL